jgi:hypothetical protein
MRHVIRSRTSTNCRIRSRHSVVCSLFGAVSLTAVGVGAAFASAQDGSVIAHRANGPVTATESGLVSVNAGGVTLAGTASARVSGGDDVHDWG